MKPCLNIIAAAMLVSGLAATSASAQAAYDDRLSRLAEVLGSVHFLRGLCGEENGPWRAQMEALLEAEAPSGERRAMLVASFNHGYRSFASVYTHCTDAALHAIKRYMKEGETLSAELVERHGN